MENKITRKTLVINHNTKFWEFYGHIDGYGWVTSSSPIHTMSDDVTWEDVYKTFPDGNFENVDLVTIDISISDVDTKFDLEYCDTCIQMTNHVKNICKKCEKILQN